MPDCELCGSERPLMPTLIEGTTLHVCQACASYGKVLPQPAISQPLVQAPLRLDKELDEILVDDFAQLIKAAREKKTLDQKNLAHLVKEKESIIHKVESGHMKPPLDLARKLEKVLHITLVHTYTPPSKVQHSKDGTLTIGDLVKVREAFLMISQKDLAITLSKLQTFSKPSAALEQYATDSELAAQFLWHAAMRGDIIGKVIADFGCGTGILGAGALLLGVKKVYFIDIDSEALTVARENLQKLQKTMRKIYPAEFLLKPVESFSRHVDVIIQNPPFGVQQEHADKVFLETAMKHADMIYTIHKAQSASFIAALAEDHGFRITSFITASFPLKKTQTFHTKKVYLVPIGIWCLQRHRKV